VQGLRVSEQVLGVEVRTRDAPEEVKAMTQTVPWSRSRKVNGSSRIPSTGPSSALYAECGGTEAARASGGRVLGPEGRDLARILSTSGRKFVRLWDFHAIHRGTFADKQGECGAFTISAVTLVPALVIALALAVAYWFPIRRWMGRWGTTSSDQARVMAGDGLVVDPTFTYTMAVTVNARPEHIWPWLL
jgi:hypothetical protein